MQPWVRGDDLACMAAARQLLMVTPCVQEKSHSRFVLTAEGRDVREQGSAEFRVHGEVKKHEGGISVKQLQASIAMPVRHACPASTFSSCYQPVPATCHLITVSTCHYILLGSMRRAEAAYPFIANKTSLYRGNCLPAPDQMCCRKCWARRL